MTPATIRTARQMYTRHQSLVQRIGRAYGIDPRMVIAVWGLESNFGRFAGVRPTVPRWRRWPTTFAAARCSAEELFSALEIVNRGDIELDRLKGSWAGALGQPQFMPSSYLRYAQDFDGDGRRDIWSSHARRVRVGRLLPAAARLEDRRTWGREVIVPAAAAATCENLPRRDGRVPRAS